MNTSNATVATPEQASWFIEPALWADMARWHDAVRDIRENHPVLRVEHPEYEPFHVLTRHADIFDVSRNNALWHNTYKSVLGRSEDIAQMEASGMLPASLVHLDGTEHRDHRRVTNDWFKPAVVGRRQPRIDELADEFIGIMRDAGGEVDFADIAQRYTLRVIMDIYGVPQEDEPLMLELTQGIFGAADPEFLGDHEDPGQRVLQSVMTFIQYFNEMTADRRQCPKDDLATVIANGEIDGQPLADDKRLWYYIIVATAGHDTTSFALAGGMEAFVRDLDQLWALRGDSGAVVNATEECIRWTTPVRHFMRYATADTEIRGVAIAEGERVLLSYPAANRDADVFDDPDTFNVHRTDADKLISFGVGAHFCLGSQFARRELRTMLSRLAEQLDHVELTGDPEWSESAFVSGVKHLPIAYRFR